MAGSLHGPPGPETATPRQTARAGHQRDGVVSAVVVDDHRLRAGHHGQRSHKRAGQRQQQSARDERITAHISPPTVRLRRSTTAPTLGSYWNREMALSGDWLRSSTADLGRGLARLVRRGHRRVLIEAVIEFTASRATAVGAAIGLLGDARLLAGAERQELAVDRTRGAGPGAADHGSRLDYEHHAVAALQDAEVDQHRLLLAREDAEPLERVKSCSDCRWLR